MRSNISRRSFLAYSLGLVACSGAQQPGSYQRPARVGQEPIVSVINGEPTTTADGFLYRKFTVCSNVPINASEEGRQAAEKVKMSQAADGYSLTSGIFSGGFDSEKRCYVYTGTSARRG